jgi:hypothetical protein
VRQRGGRGSALLSALLSAHAQMQPHRTLRLLLGTPCPCLTSRRAPLTEPVTPAPHPSCHSHVRRTQSRRLLYAYRLALPLSLSAPCPADTRPSRLSHVHLAIRTCADRNRAALVSASQPIQQSLTAPITPTPHHAPLTPPATPVTTAILHGCIAPFHNNVITAGASPKRLRR